MKISILIPQNPKETHDGIWLSDAIKMKNAQEFAFRSLFIHPHSLPLWRKCGNGLYYTKQEMEDFFCVKLNREVLGFIGEGEVKK